MQEEEIKKALKDRFERTATVYGKGLLGTRVHLRNHIKRISKIAEILQVAKGDNVLEVGIGTGVHAEWICSKHGVNLVGVDIAANMLKEAEKRLEHIKGVQKDFVLADATALPFKKNIFDGAFCVGTIQYTIPPWKTIEEMVRVVKPGKKIVIISSNYLYPMDFITYHRKKNYKFLPKIFANKLREWANNAGLVDVVVENILFTPSYPKKLLHLYDVIDRLMLSNSFLRKFSMNLLLSGKKVLG